MCCGQSSFRRSRVSYIAGHTPATRRQKRMSVTYGLCSYQPLFLCNSGAFVLRGSVSSDLPVFGSPGVGVFESPGVWIFACSVVRFFDCSVVCASVSNRVTARASFLTAPRANIPAQRDSPTPFRRGWGESGQSGELGFICLDLGSGFIWPAALKPGRTGTSRRIRWPVIGGNHCV